MRPNRLAAVGLLAGLAIAATALAVIGRGGGDDASGDARPVRPLPDSGRPNIVVVMTDDQALDTMEAMPRTRRLVGAEGVVYEKAISTFPLCCPSRATFLTAQYAHNHGVRDNHPPAGGYQSLDARRTLPVWLKRAGYRTAFVGKFLNGYGENGATEVPPGWDEWYALPGDAKQRAFDFDLIENGKLVPYKGTERRYKTAVLADRSAEIIDRNAPRREPFFLWVATNGPHRDSHLPKSAHRNPEPAPRDRGRFEGRTPPDNPAVNELDVSDKPANVRKLPSLDERTRERLGREYVSQLESLIAIDRLVGRLVRKLERAGELDQTLFVFTSDNGFIRGQHRLEGKSRLYEESIRVPLMIRGPGFPVGSRVGELVPNVDVPATILDLAGAQPDLRVDGRTLRPDGRTARRDAVLLEVFERRQAFTGVRTDRWAYAEYESGERELYDLERDPRELDNRARDPAYAPIRDRLAARLAELRDCAGPEECG